MTKQVWMCRPSVYCISRELGFSTRKEIDPKLPYLPQEVHRWETWRKKCHKLQDVKNTNIGCHTWKTMD